MTVIEFAEKRLNESCLNDDDEAVLYWRAYLDGARAQKKEGTVMEWISVNTDIDWFVECDYCGCKWECLPEPPREV